MVQASQLRIFTAQSAREREQVFYSIMTKFINRNTKLPLIVTPLGEPYHYYLLQHFSPTESC